MKFKSNIFFLPIVLKSSLPSVPEQYQIKTTNYSWLQVHWHVQHVVHREQCGDHRDTHLGRPPHEGEAKDAGGEDIDKGKQPSSSSSSSSSLPPSYQVGWTGSSGMPPRRSWEDRKGLKESDLPPDLLHMVALNEGNCAINKNAKIVIPIIQLLFNIIYFSFCITGSHAS